MSDIIYYDIDWFEDGLHPVWGDSDQEGNPQDVGTDDMDRDILSQQARDHYDESHQVYQQSLSQQRNNITIPIQATLNDGDIFSDHISYDSYGGLTPRSDFFRVYYDDDDDHHHHHWGRWDGWARLVTADTYSWWWFPIVIERVNNELYNWGLWGYRYSDSNNNTWNHSHDERYAWGSNQDSEDEGIFSGSWVSGWGPITPNEIDETLPNLANFPPDRDYFIHPRHPTDQWWPLS